MEFTYALRVADRLGENSSLALLNFSKPGVFSTWNLVLTLLIFLWSNILLIFHMDIYS
jgi:hypothetical protein